VKQSDISHIMLAIFLSSSPVSSSFYLLVKNTPPSHNANIIEQKMHGFLRWHNSFLSMVYEVGMFMSLVVTPQN